MERIRREYHLLSGLGVQVLVVALMVFAYTQAARQLKAQRQMYLELKEQITRAREQVAKEGTPDLARLKAQMDELEGRLATPAMLSDGLRRLENVARDRFGFRDVQIRSGQVEKTIRIPRSDEKPPFEVQLLSIELEATAATRQTADFLARIGEANPNLVCSMQGMTLAASDPGQPLPVAVHLKWLVAASGSAEAAQEVSRAPGGARGAVTEGNPRGTSDSRSHAPLAWGPREEPFLSPVTHPDALRSGPETSARFRLTGILWDSKEPTCVVNGVSLKTGDLIKGHRLVLITQKAVLLDGPPEGEIVLFLP